MKTRTDFDGQPVSAGFNAQSRTERDISEMLGLVKGILADGVVNERKTLALRDWLRAHPDVTEKWPGEAFSEKLRRIFTDGVITYEECEDLRELLSEMVGGQAGIIGGENASTSLPLDKPVPKIVFPHQVFVFTGKFAFGPRSACEKLTQDAGGICEETVTRRTRYLVVGTFGSRDWIHSPYGRKIEKAVEFKTSGQSISIICEDHWAASLPKAEDKPDSLSGKTFVLTGTLSSLSRDEASELVRKAGGSITSLVSKNTNYVVVGENPGSKHDKAQRLNVTILTEEEFLKLTNKDNK